MEPANEAYDDQQKTKKDWREISKTQGVFITLFIVSLYAYTHWKIIQNGYFWALGLTITFSIGIAFGFLVNIKPGRTDILVFNHQELKTKWINGLCFVPSLLPFLHRIGIRILWSLKEMHHEEPLIEENRTTFNHNVNFDSRNITQVKTEVDFWTLKYWEIGARIFKWFFSKHKNPVFVYQDFGFKIIVIVLVLDCLSFGTASVVNLFSSNSSKEQVVATQSAQQSIQPQQVVQLVQKQETQLKIHQDKDSGVIEVDDGVSKLNLVPMFWYGGKSKNNSDQTTQQKCKWTYTDWNVDLVSNPIDMGELGGCIDFYPPNGKEVGIRFDNMPMETNGNFSVRSKYDEKICQFSSSDNCLNFIGSHLDEILVFEGNFFINTGKENRM